MAFGTCCVVGRIFDEERKDVFCNIYNLRRGFPSFLFFDFDFDFDF